jgi:NAD(P)-dependent dehydrogenase (short-subunit alcohol dehydrogenase family)
MQIRLLLQSILTGAGGGIGLSIVTQLLAQPSVSLVVGVDVVTSQLEALLEGHSGRLSIVQGDVSLRATSERAVQEALSRKGRLDSIILNAAILNPLGRAAETSVDDWKRLFDINFFGLLHSVSGLIPMCRTIDMQELMYG